MVGTHGTDFIADVYTKELSENEKSDFIKYYRYRYKVNFSHVKKLYLIMIIGSEICLDIICGNFSITTECKEAASKKLKK